MKVASVFKLPDAVMCRLRIESARGSSGRSAKQSQVKWQLRSLDTEIDSNSVVIIETQT